MKQKKKITDFFKVFRLEHNSNHTAPLYEESVQAGFPSPAEDYLEGTLDLNELFIHRPSSTYIVRVAGDSMVDAGIYEGDLLVVDRSLDPKNNDIVIAEVDGEFTVKRFVRKDDHTIVLEPANINYSPIVVTGEHELLIWGVVVGVLRKLR